MYRPLISVIVPVYKAEPYLARCIESILNQTYGYIELILIDDGSPDRSGQICDEYAARDTRVKVFHKKNGGVSSARNLGLQNAVGDVIFFCDSDDWIDKHAFEACRYCEKYDIVQLPRDGGSNYQIYDKDASCEKSGNLSRFICLHFTCEIWGKLFRKETVYDSSFSTDISIGEDVMFLLRVYRNTTSYYIKSSNLMEDAYHYNASNSQSLMNSQVNVNSDRDMLLAIMKEHRIHETLRMFFVTTSYWRLLWDDIALLMAYKTICSCCPLSFFSLPKKTIVKSLLLWLRAYSYGIIKSKHSAI